MKIAMVLFKYGVPISDPCCWPLGFMTISSVLKQNGHEVTVFNKNISDDIMYLDDYDVVCMTSFEEFKQQIIDLGAMCKSIGVKTIVGGALSTFQSEEMAQHVDCVIIGEGEDVIEQALHSTGIIQGTKPNLDNTPLPDYDGFGIEKYHKLNGFKHIGVLTSRGCPHACKFCVQTCHFQYRDLYMVFEEIDLYTAKYGVKFIVFNDNTLNINKSRFLLICEGMKNRGLEWSAAIRADKFDSEMAIAAKESGCKWFVVGVESFDQCKLDAMNKKVKVGQIYNTLNLLERHGIGYHGNILLGLPDETEEDIINEVKNIPFGYNLFPCLVQPFVGTEYQTRVLTDAQIEKFTNAFRDFTESKGMSMNTGDL